MKEYIVVSIGDGYFDCKEKDNESTIRVIPYIGQQLKIKQEVLDDKKTTTIEM